MNPQQQSTTNVITYPTSPIDPTVHTIQFANIGVNRVIVKSTDTYTPSTPTTRITKARSTFEPINTHKRNGPLIIHNKRWYFRLVSKDGEYKRARALMDDFNINKIVNHLVICFIPDKIPGNNRPFRKQNGEPIHIFAFFDSYLEFYDYMQLFNPEDRVFFEIIFGELPQKPHFDIDVNMADLNALFPGDDINVTAELLRESVIRGCIEVLNNDFDLTRDLLQYSSHGTDKRSYHIVLNNKCHDGNKEAKAFYDAVMAKVNSYTGGKYAGSNFVDPSVYSPRQQFRMVGSQKYGSGRPKIFYEIFEYQGQTYNHIYSDDVDDLVMKKLTIIYESMVSFTSGCVFLPSLVPPKPMNHLQLANMPDLDGIIVNLCMNMLQEKMKPCPFTYREVKGHMILLRREAPSHCPICRKAEAHEKEHPFIFIIGGKVYWDCRRAGDKPKLFLGYLAMTLDEMMTSGVHPGFSSLTQDDNNDVDEGGEFMFGDFDIGLPTLPPLKKVSEAKVSPPRQLTPNANVDIPKQSISNIVPTAKLSPNREPISEITCIDGTVIPIIDIPPEQRMQNVIGVMSQITNIMTQRKDIRKEPTNFPGVITLPRTGSWTAGIPTSR